MHVVSNRPDQQEQIRAARSRYYLASRWSGPAGTVAAAVLWTLLVGRTEEPPEHLTSWLSVMLVTVVIQIAAFSSARLRIWISADGTPNAARLAHLLIGVGFGAALWIDLDSTRLPEFRWITLACLFAVTAGVVSGFAGFNALGQLVALPMWFGATTALLVTGQPIAALAGGVFAAIIMRDMVENGKRWGELLELRIRSHAAAEEHLWAATHDPLTGIANRTGVMNTLDSRMAASDGLVTLMFVDLDHFKEVNDRHGHAAGDDVLVETARRLTSLLRSVDVAGRLGGDEFCVVLSGEQTEATVTHLAERIIEGLERPMSGSWGDDEVYISASVGIASLDPTTTTSEQLLLEADHALYEAKRTGRRRAVRFNQQLRTELQERNGLEFELRRAIREGRLHADGQPAFDITTGEVVAVELLARWRLDSGVDVPPSVFIPIAEEIGLIDDLTQFMLEIAGRQLEIWRDDPMLSGAKVSVNVSAVDIARGTLLGRVAEALTTYDIPSGRLVLELTESHQLGTAATDLSQFHELRSMGVRIAIDDFGTGYSSLDQLLSLPIDAVKLDLSLIANLGVDPRQSEVVRCIHDLAAVVASSVIVEGVETAEQLEILRSLDIRYAQGYHLGHPVPADDLAQHLRQIEIPAARPTQRRNSGSGSL